MGPGTVETQSAKAAKRAVLTRASKQLEPQLRQMEQETHWSLISCCLLRWEILVHDSNTKIRLTTEIKSPVHAKSRTNLSSAVAKVGAETLTEGAGPIHEGFTYVADQNAEQLTGGNYSNQP
jgi:hypothetical protein